MVSRISFGSCTRLGLMLVLGSGLMLVQADEPKGDPLVAQELLVPLEELASWPAGDREPIKLSEWRELQRAAQPRPPAPPQAALERAEYSATLQGELLSGSLQWTVRGPDDDARAFLPLDPLELAVGDLTWSDNRRAVWGKHPETGTVLVVDQPADTLTGNWQLAGQAAGDLLEWNFAAPAATLTVLKVLLPDHLVLSGSGVEIFSRQPAAEPGWSEWQAWLGGASRCRLRAMPSVAATDMGPLVLAQANTVYAIRADSLRLESDWNLEVLQRPVTELRWELSGDLQPYAVQFGEVALPWTVALEDNVRQLRVQLPAPLTGSGQRLRIRAIGTVLLEQVWELPQITLLNGLRTVGDINLQVDVPLELKQIDAVGFRQTAFASSDPEREVLSYRRLDDRAALKVTVGTPAPRLQATVFTDVRTGGEAWNSVTQVHWEATAGQIFDLDLQIPDGWDVTDVSPTEGSPSSEIASWEILNTEGEPRRLRVHLVEALSAASPKHLEIRATAIPFLPDHAGPIPAWEPQETDKLEMLVALGNEGTTRAVPEPATTFDPVQVQEIPPEWANSEFWKPRLSRPNPSLLLRLRESPCAGNFFLQALQIPLDVRSLTQAELGMERLAEQFRLQVHPRYGRADRLLVYLTEPGPTPAWSLGDPRSLPLTARKFPVARHAAWDLPPTGELWEIRLPTAEAGEFVVTGERTRGTPVVGKVGLAFVPEANSFHGSVEVRTAPGTRSSLQAQLLEPATPGPAPMNDEFERVAWTYTRPGAGLQFRLANASDVLPVIIERLELNSRLGTASAETDLHIAKFHLRSGFTAGQFQWSLPTGARLVEVELDGEAVVPEPYRLGWRLTNLVPDEPHLVEIRYEVQVPAGTYFTRHAIPLPQTEWTVVDFRWELQVAPDFAIAPVMVGIPLDRQVGDRLNWRERLFGVLARGGRSTAPVREAVLPSTINKEDETLPGLDDWTVRSAAAPLAPLDLQVTVVSRQRLYAAGWGMLCFSVGVGLLLQWFPLAWRRGLLCVLLGLSCGTACQISAPWAIIWGSATSGLLLGTFVPWIDFGKLLPQRIVSTVPTGSTQSYRHAPAMGQGVLLLLLSAGLAFGQGSTPPPREAIPRATGPETVWIPIDPTGKPAGKIPLAYASRELLARYRKLAAQNQALPDYLIESADYQLQLNEMAEWWVTLRVHRLNQDRETAVRLPFAGVQFGGQDACLVNGQPAPLGVVQNPPGIQVLLPAAPLPADTTPAVPPGPTPAVPYTIELRFQSPIIGTVVDFEVPPFAATSLVAEWSSPVVRPEVIGARGGTTLGADSRRLRSVIGGLSRLQLAWRASAEAPVPGLVELRATGLVDLQQNLATYQYRLTGRVTERSLRRLSIPLPPRTVVRSLRWLPRVEHPLVSTPTPMEPLTVRGPNESRLEIPWFDPLPAGSEFTLWLDFVTVPATLQNQFQITPLAQVQADVGVECKLLSQQLAVRAPNDFQLSGPTDLMDRGTLLDIDAFLEAWGTSEARPQWAARLNSSAPLTFQNRATEPQRLARIEYVGVASERRLVWTIQALVEIRHAAVFQHELEIDPRLLVTAVSVQENSAQRLWRWTRKGDRILLMLRDQSAGLQSITITATMPVTVPQTVTLPRVVLKDAEISEQLLTLYETSELSVELQPMPGVERVELPPPPVSDDSLLLYGRYRIPSNVTEQTFRTGRNLPEIECNSLTLLESRDNRWKLTTGLRFQVREGHGSRFLVRIPPELTNWEINAPDVRVLQEKDPDGATIASLLPLQPVRSELTVRVSGSVNSPETEGWQVPEVAPVSMPLQQAFVMIAPAGALEVPEPRISGLKPATLPRALQNLAPPGPAAPSDLGTYESVARPWQVEVPRLNKPASASQQSARLADTQFWTLSNGTVLARTEWWLAPTVLDLFDIQLPGDVRTIAVFVDGRLQPWRTSEEGRLEFALQAPQLPQRVTLIWQILETSAQSWNARRIPLPVAQNLLVERTLFTAVPESGGAAWLGAAGAGTVPTTEAARDRINAFLEWWQARSEADPGDGMQAREAWDRVAWEVAEIARREPTWIEQSAGGQGELLQKLAAGGQQFVAPPAGPADWPVLHSPRGSVVAAAVVPDQVQIWNWNFTGYEPWITFLATVVTTLSAIGLTRRPWFPAQPAPVIGLLSVAAWWWFCLQVPWIALPGIVLAVMLWRALRPTPAPVEG